MVVLGTSFAFDVAHVWATAYLTYLDKQAFRARRTLYLWAPPLSFLVAFALHLTSPVVFWTALSYFAIAFQPLGVL